MTYEQRAVTTIISPPSLTAWASTGSGRPGPISPLIKKRGLRIYMKFKPAIAGALAGFLLMAAGLALAASGQSGRQHFIYWAGTPQEMHVYKIFGRYDGPTVMIIGGIQGDEPGGYLSADAYADLTAKRGNLIVVPRANFKSIVMSHRGPNGDMNRKFSGDLGNDPDRTIVESLKSLMAESDLVLNLHDGSGYYRPTWESEMANPNRYGQCIIADAEVYTHPQSGRILPLADYARDVVDRVNQDIDDPLHKFHFFNTRTDEPDSWHKEQRGSVTYYCMTQLGIPAFGVETSKQLPSLELKVHQHNLAVNAFLEVFGMELEQSRLNLEPASINHLIITVNDTLPLALTTGQTLRVAAGDSIEVVQVGANYDRGLSVKTSAGPGTDFNILGKAFRVEKPLTLIVSRDNKPIGRIPVALLPADEGPAPKVSGLAKINPHPGATYIYDETELAGLGPEIQPGQSKGLSQPISPPPGPGLKTQEPPAAISPEDGTSTEPPVQPGSAGEPRTIPPPPGRITSAGPAPRTVVMNLKGFLPKSKAYQNDGEDRGFTADTGKDMMPQFSEGQKGRVYKINAEVGKDVISSCSIKLVSPKLEAVTIEVDGRKHTLKLGGRLPIVPGSQVTVHNIELAGGRKLSNPRYTLGGKPFSSDLPQTLTMPGFGANLAVFNGEVLAGKVLWALPPR